MSDSFEKYKKLSLKLTRELRFKADWEEIEAAHGVLLRLSHDMEDATRKIQPCIFMLMTKYEKSLSVRKVIEFCDIIRETDGVEEARETVAHAVIVKVGFHFGLL